ncbi:beta-glucosidase [Bifidobacterium sp. LC6]|uniref:Beta-glucosidase n=2 Tax=Bifidobacterium TaxID=1678 RepID=A0A2N5ITN0_9BIFI|nr:MULTISPECIES: GH1 family beta-glucosidase [Bifidobacterium]MBT1174660.1 beta-glucosidase [Bifidobacterium colobi]PLS25325.1 beta-glucosidase [Bifidobacterium imperatoris]QSY57916.1 beta-glucosidase [Bifidobacterium imperatoris]
MTFAFPNDFTWGTATASYQVEGAAHEGGRTDSIWDTFCAKPGTIADGTSGEKACDQYHRYMEDIDIMKRIGVGAYRFSVSWTRIFPEFDGPVNQEGLDYYLRLLDALREAGIKPVCTMYHWDLPQYLEDRGGWPNRDTAKRYADYARTLAQAFGDRVDTWTTLNEPWCTAYLGYGNGVHAPGIKDYAKALEAVHHLNLAHGLGIQAIRSVLGDDARMSVTLNPAVNIAETDAPEDLLAKQRADLINNEVFYGPMLQGRYDSGIFDVTRDITDWSFVKDGDMEEIHQPLDVLGLNYYSTTHVRHAAPGTVNNGPVPAQDIVESLPPAGALTAMGWNQEPQGLTGLLTELSTRFPDLPLMVTENGSAWDDVVTEDAAAPGGKIVHDPQRVNYMNQHIQAVADALEAGANVTGYYAWSLLDNFEWALGLSKRFGIIRVDYDTEERIWKDSALRFRDIVRANAI